jgi:hypothetical protein
MLPISAPQFAILINNFTHSQTNASLATSPQAVSSARHPTPAAFVSAGGSEMALAFASQFPASLLTSLLPRQFPLCQQQFSPHTFCLRRPPDPGRLLLHCSLCSSSVACLLINMMPFSSPHSTAGSGGRLAVRDEVDGCQCHISPPPLFLFHHIFRLFRPLPLSLPLYLLLPLPSSMPSTQCPQQQQCQCQCQTLTHFAFFITLTAVFHPLASRSSAPETERGADDEEDNNTAAAGRSSSAPTFLCAAAAVSVLLSIVLDSQSWRRPGEEGRRGG